MRIPKLTSLLAALAFSAASVFTLATPASASATLVVNPSTFAPSTLIANSFTATVAGMNINGAAKINASIQGWSIPGTCANTPTGTLSNCGITSITIDGAPANVWVGSVGSSNAIFFENQGSAWTQTSASIVITFAANAFTTPAATFSGVPFSVSSYAGAPIDAATVIVIPADDPYASCAVNGAGSMTLGTFGNGGTTGTGATCAAYRVMNPTTTAPANPFTRAGYDFAGWNTAADGSGRAYAVGARITVNVGSRTDLYAQWTASASGSSDATTGSAGLATTGPDLNGLILSALALLGVGSGLMLRRRTSA